MNFYAATFVINWVLTAVSGLELCSESALFYLNELSDHNRQVHAALIVGQGRFAFTDLAGKLTIVASYTAPGPKLPVNFGD